VGQSSSSTRPTVMDKSPTTLAEAAPHTHHLRLPVNRAALQGAPVKRGGAWGGRPAQGGVP